MALIYCPKCGTQISDQAEACNKCSYQLRDTQPKIEYKKTPINERANTTNIADVAKGVFLILIVVAVGYYFYHINTDEYKKEQLKARQEAAGVH